MFWFMHNVANKTDSPYELQAWWEKKIVSSELLCSALLNSTHEHEITILKHDVFRIPRSVENQIGF